MSDLTGNSSTPYPEDTAEASNGLHAEALYPLLALRLQEWNEARGIAGITPKVAQLLELWAREQYQQWLRGVAFTEKAMVDLGMIGIERLKLRMRQAQTLEEKNRIYKQARELIGEIGEAVGNLEASTDGSGYDADQTDGDRDHND